MYRSLMALLFVSTVLAAPVPKEKPALYFPAREGIKRVFQATTGDSVTEWTETITKVEVKTDVFRVTVSREAEKDNAVYEVSEKGISQVTERGTVPLLKLPVKVDDAWLNDPTLSGDEVLKAFRIGKEEEVEVPAGKFKAIPVHVSGVGGSACPVRPSTYWYAPGIGLVKSTSRGESHTTVVLKSIAEGK